MNRIEIAFGASLLACAPAFATPYEWDGADGSATFGNVAVEKADGAASLTGTNSGWVYSDPTSYASLVGIDLVAATTLSSLTVANGVDFMAKPGTLDQGDGALPAAIAVNHGRATFAASQEHPINSSSTISGAAGVVAFTGDGSGGIEMGDDTYRTSSDKIAKSADATWDVLENTRLADLVSVVGNFRSGGSTLPSACYFFKNDGKTASVQFQSTISLYAAGDQAGIEGGIIDFKQEGADILYRQRGSTGYYVRANNPGYEQPGSFEFKIIEGGGTIYPVSPTGASWTSWWGMSDLVMTFKSKVGTYVPLPEVTLGAASAITRETSARFEFGDEQGSPVNVKVNNNAAFSGASCVLIHSNATVTLTVIGDYDKGYGLSGIAWTILEPCAKLVSTRYFSIGRWSGVELGEGSVWEQKDSIGTYLSSLKYHGAKTIGNISIGYGTIPNVKVDGNGVASVHDGNINVYTYTHVNLTFDIADATGTPDADYTVTGGFGEVTPGANNDITFYKSGAGTMRLEGPIEHVRYPFHLCSGVLEFGASGVSSSALGLTADYLAATLSCAANTTNAIGTLTIEAKAANLTIDMKENAELSIASVAEWAANYPAVLLNIVAAEGARVRIGQSADDLPASVRIRMRLNGKRCLTDENGYVVGRSDGTIIMFK